MIHNVKYDKTTTFTHDNNVVAATGEVYSNINDHFCLCCHLRVDLKPTFAAPSVKASAKKRKSPNLMQREDLSLCEHSGWIITQRPATRGWRLSDQVSCSFCVFKKI